MLTHVLQKGMSSAGGTHSHRCRAAALFIQGLANLQYRLECNCQERKGCENHGCCNLQSDLWPPLKRGHCRRQHPALPCQKGTHLLVCLMRTQLFWRSSALRHASSHAAHPSPFQDGISAFFLNASWCFLYLPLRQPALPGSCICISSTHPRHDFRGDFYNFPGELKQWLSDKSRPKSQNTYHHHPRLCNHFFNFFFFGFP